MNPSKRPLNVLNLLLCHRCPEAVAPAVLLHLDGTSVIVLLHVQEGALRVVFLILLKRYMSDRAPLLACF